MLCPPPFAVTGPAWTAADRLAWAMADLAIDCGTSEDAQVFYDCYDFDEEDSDLHTIKKAAAGISTTPETFQLKEQVGRAVRQGKVFIAGSSSGGATSSLRAAAEAAAAVAAELGAVAAGAAGPVEGGEAPATAADHLELLKANYSDLAQQYGVLCERLELGLSDGQRQDTLENVLELQLAARCLHAADEAEGNALAWLVEQCRVVLNSALP